MPREDVLSLAELDAFDPGPRHGEEWRYCCPRPGCQGKTVSRAHRSVSVNSRTGAWHCHRCGESGLLLEWRDPAPARPAFSPRQQSRAAARRTFALGEPAPRASRRATPTLPPPAAVAPAAARALPDLPELLPLAGTPAEAYLRGRGLADRVAEAAGARYAPRWYGGPAVVFPIVDAAGVQVAAQGRYLDSAAQPKARTVGRSRDGVFVTRPAAWASALVIVTEAPLDALSIAHAGFAALALVGTHFPAWLPRALALKWVFLAHDADAAGDDAAARLTAALHPLGARLERLRPAGGKDWNELLQQHGRSDLADALGRIVLPRLLQSAEEAAAAWT